MDAKILPFPGRNDRREPRGAGDARSRGLARPTASVLPVEYGSGWYHEAAIKDRARSLRHED